MSMIGELTVQADRNSRCPREQWNAHLNQMDAILATQIKLERTGDPTGTSE
jgi:hypothetical protein